MKLLNIYGQYDNHTPARIVGNREGLEALKMVIEEALKKGSSISMDRPGNYDDPLFASDGEGYELGVVMSNDQWGFSPEKGQTEPDPKSFWEKEESNPLYLMHKIQEAVLEFQDKLGIDYFARQLTIKGKTGGQEKNG